MFHPGLVVTAGGQPGAVRAEPADAQIEALPREAADLRIGARERDVADRLRLGELPGCSMAGAKMSPPSTLPTLARRVASRVVCPLPHPLSRT